MKVRDGEKVFPANIWEIEIAENSGRIVNVDKRRKTID
jgi:hypothetical protein